MTESAPSTPTPTATSGVNTGNQPAPQIADGKQLQTGVKLVVARIKNFSHRYTDDPGAHFITMLQEKSGDDGVVDFFRRLETEGFDIKLNDVESQILDEVRKKSSPKALLDQVSLTAGASAALTRRQALRRLGTGALLIASQGVLTTLGNTSKQVTKIGESLKDAEEKLSDPKLSEEDRKKYEEQKKAAEEQMKQTPLGAIGKTIAKYPVATLGVIIMLSQIASLGTDVYKHANEKKDKIINITSNFVNYRLGYDITRPPDGTSKAI